MPIVDEFFKELPPGYRIAQGSDFHTHGKVNLGMKYLVYSFLMEVYQCYIVNERLTGDRLKEFLKDDRVFIQNEQLQLF